MEQTTARLRKTFQYKNDDDSDESLPEALDEEGTLKATPDLRPFFLQFRSISFLIVKHFYKS